mgnify:CR=1 FL=1
MEEIINKVAKSPLISLDLEDYLSKEQIMVFDIALGLFEGIILKEKDFRRFLDEMDWSIYVGKNVGIICSADAIIPIWAYMLIVTYLEPVANVVTQGDAGEVEKAVIDQAVERLVTDQDLQDAKVVIKGCGAVNNKEYAYSKITLALVSKVTRLMYGEPCSVVPVFKKRRQPR